MPVLVNPSRFGPPPTPGSGYAATVLADSPWGFWQLLETTGTTLADSSPNGRDMTIAQSITAPSLAQSGPSTFMPAIAWPATDTTDGHTTATFSSSTGTVEVWFYLTANPSLPLSLAACQNSGGGSLTKFLQINTDGTIAFGITGSTFATSASPVSLNTWHHAVGSIGAAGTKVRLDKTTVATAANTTSSSSAIAAGLHRKLGGTTTTPGAVLSTAAFAVWTSQLTDAKTDAHYDAMFA